MAQFYASILGQAKTTATRRGSRGSGIEGHIRGWNIGIKVIGGIADNGNDSFDVYLTGGSLEQAHAKLIGTFTEADLDK